MELGRDSRDVENLFGELRSALRSGRHVLIGDRPPGSGIPLSRERIVEEAEALASKADELANKLRALMTEHDSVDVLSAVMFKVRSVLLPSDNFDTAPETFSWDAKSEYLQGLALTTVRGSVVPTDEIIDEVMGLADQLFDAEQAKILIRSIGADTEEREGLDVAVLLLGLENLVDRMEGYAIHLDAIYSEVFEPLRAECEAEFGFCPGDVGAIVRGFVRAINSEINLGRDEMFRILEEHGEILDPELVDQEVIERIGLGFRRVFDFSVWDPSDVADRVAPEENVIHAMLEAMSSDWACQPDFRFPLDANRARTHPVVPLGDGRFWVPRPWDLLHGLLRWWNSELNARSLDRLKQRYGRSRDRATEQLASSTLATVFGHDHVFSSQHFDGPRGHGEVDSLVAAADYPLALEAKAASLTPPGRRGAPRRVSRVADDVIEHSFDQLRHVIDYIGAGGREFASTEGGERRRVLTDGVVDVVSIVVTFERMDPVASQASYLARSEELEAVWVVNLSDLMMIADVLRHPAEFLSYARLRGNIASGSITTYVESDLLAVFIDDRLAELATAAAQEGVEDVVIGYSSTPINVYFISGEMGEPTERPSADVPQPVLDRLAGPVSDPGWGMAAVVMMDVLPGDWKRWKKFVRRRLNRGLSSVRYRFDSPNLEIVISSEEGGLASTDEHGLLTLHIPLEEIESSDLA